jgi:hypothetical protein
MINIYNKEDMGLTKDIEVLEDVQGLYGAELDSALDNPVNRMMFLFPNKDNPEESVKDIKLRIMSVNISIPLRMELDDVITMWSAKTGKSGLDLDIMCNMIIDADFRLMTEMEVENDWMKIHKHDSHSLKDAAKLKYNLFYEEEVDHIFSEDEDDFYLSN